MGKVLIAAFDDKDEIAFDELLLFLKSNSHIKVVNAFPNDSCLKYDNLIYDYLDEAINYYKKGFIIKNDYYNGENYSNCLLLKTQKPDLEVDEIEYLKFESKKVCREIISLLEENIRDNEINYWMYATLATCYLCLKDEKNYQKYEAEFLANTTIEWEIETYKNTIADTKKILMIE